MTHMEQRILDLIRDWRSRPAPKNGPTYLVEVSRHNQRLMDAMELETELKILRAEKLLRRK